MFIRKILSTLFCLMYFIALISSYSIVFGQGVKCTPDDIGVKDGCVETSVNVVAVEDVIELLYPVGGVETQDRRPTFRWDNKDALDFRFYKLFLRSKSSNDPTDIPLIHPDNLIAMIGAIGIEEYQLTQPQTLELGEYEWRLVIYYFDGSEDIRSNTAWFRIIPGESPETADDDSDGKQKPVVSIFEADLEESLPALTSFALANLAIASFIAVSVPAATITNISSLGRLIFGLLFGWILDRNKKYWGIVYDRKTSRSLPFTIIRLYKNKPTGSNPESPVYQSVSDMSGRYGFKVGEDGNYWVEIRSGGFEPLIEQISVKQNREVVADFGLVSRKVSKDANLFLQIFRKFKVKIFYRRNIISKIINRILLLITVFGFAYTAYITHGNPHIVNHLILAFYVVIFLINGVIIAYGIYTSKSVGEVLDTKTKVGIGGVVVRFFIAEKQLRIAMTNDKGELKVRIKPGKYDILISKEGYVNVGKHKLEFTQMTVNRDGYFNKDIFLKKVSNSFF